MIPLLFRDLDTSSETELDQLTRLCMTVVLETLPEVAGDPAAAKRLLPNFDFDQMRDMIRADFDRPTHRFLVGVDQAGVLHAFSAISVKVDAQGVRYGYFFSRYVSPGYRRQGVATRFLLEALSWFAEQRVAYLRAETHVSNVALQGLFLRHGFERSEPQQGRWPYYVLTRRLSGPGQ